MDQCELSVVTPVFNEEEVVAEFFHRVSEVLKHLEISSYEVVFVDDGSTDGTFALLEKLYQSHPEYVRVVRLARNFGHQVAITAGMRTAKGKAVVIMDCDLQDPPEMIKEFVRYWKEGHDVVYGVRTRRNKERWFKKATAAVFYRMIRRATNIDIPADVGDFYLLDRKVLDVFDKLREQHRFIRGLVAWTGFRRKGVEYVREGRYAGKTKFGFWRMLKFSFDAITAFSFMPLRMISLMGMVVSFFAFLMILWTVYLRLFTNETIVGWSSLMTVILFLGGIQLLSVGVIGEYIARIGDDVKRRPLYTIQNILQ